MNEVVHSERLILGEIEGLSCFWNGSWCLLEIYLKVFELYFLATFDSVDIRICEDALLQKKSLVAEQASRTCAARPR